MRVISGTARGMKLETLPKEDTRPTIERVKEAMFSAIQFAIPGAVVLDLFAGSGQLGIEALSHGASRCVFVDDSREATDVIIKNLKSTHLFEKSRVLFTTAENYLPYAKDAFDIVFLDPPYKQNIVERILPKLHHLLSEEAIVFCETESTAKLPEKTECLQLVKTYKYGKVLVWRYEKRSSPASEE